jgi:hypothetical protein
MVIQSNMSPKSIVQVWENTREVFEKYKIPHTNHTLQSTVEENVLINLLKELNAKVGSSTETCIEGG